MNVLHVLFRASLVAVLWCSSIQPAAAQATKSAQSDCAREASRRGYAVLSTRNFRQYGDGWSMDMSVRDSRGRVSEGSCYVETRTGDVSLYGFGWGNDAPSGSEPFQFNCASIDKKYRECQLPVDGRARLVKRWSDSRCDEGYSWGQRGDRVWVDRGCRARFEVVRGGGGGSGGLQSIDCRSAQGRYTECRIQRGYVGRLVRDYNGRCRTSNDWGSRDGVIWVDHGCSGRFELMRNGGWGGGAGGGSTTPAKAEQACINEARRQGWQVVRQEAARAISGGYGVNLGLKRKGNGPVYDAFCRYPFNTGRPELQVREPQPMPR